MGGRNDTPQAITHGCCRGFLIKPRAKPDFSAQALEQVQTILARRDRLPHPWRVRAQEPVKLAYKKGIRIGIIFWRWNSEVPAGRTGAQPDRVDGLPNGKKTALNQRVARFLLAALRGDPRLLQCLAVQR